MTFLYKKYIYHIVHFRCVKLTTEHESEFHTAQEETQLNIISKKAEEIKRDTASEDLENTLWQSAITDLEPSKNENMELVIDPCEIAISNCVGPIENHQPKIAYIESHEEKRTTITCK